MLRIRVQAIASMFCPSALNSLGTTVAMWTGRLPAGPGPLLDNFGPRARFQVAVCTSLFARWLWEGMARQGPDRADAATSLAKRHIIQAWTRYMSLQLVCVAFGA